MEAEHIRHVMWGISWLTYGKFTLICIIAGILWLFGNYKLSQYLYEIDTNGFECLQIFLMIVTVELLSGLLIHTMIWPVIHYIIYNW